MYMDVFGFGLTIVNRVFIIKHVSFKKKNKICTVPLLCQKEFFFLEKNSDFKQ